jgi:hypothetical protein
MRSECYRFVTVLSFFKIFMNFFSGCFFCQQAVEEALKGPGPEEETQPASSRDVQPFPHLPGKKGNKGFIKGKKISEAATFS